MDHMDSCVWPKLGDLEDLLVPLHLDVDLCDWPMQFGVSEDLQTFIARMESINGTTLERHAL